MIEPVAGVSKFVYTKSSEKCALWTPLMVNVENSRQRGQSPGQNPSIGGTREFFSDFYVGMCLRYLAEAEVRGCLHKKTAKRMLEVRHHNGRSARTPPVAAAVPPALSVEVL